MADGSEKWKNCGEPRTYSLNFECIKVAPGKASTSPVESPNKFRIREKIYIDTYLFIINIEYLS
jgi:hypothetical protein